MPAHVNSLPVEILSEIFAYTLPHPPQFTSNLPPLVLTQVSPYWRQVALSTSSLWSTIAISQKHVKQERLMSLVHLWLERSGNYPLQMSIDLFNGEDVIIRVDDYNQHRKIYRELKSTLLPHLHRLEVFTGRLPPSVASTYKFDAMEKLRELKICGITEMSLGPPKPLLWSRPLPNLQKLSIQNFEYSCDVVSMQPRLTHLELTDAIMPGMISPAWVMLLLQNLPSLNVCAIEVTSALHEPDLRAKLERIGRTMHLPALEKLYIAWEDEVNIEDLLEHIIAPRLNRLCLRGTPRPSPGSGSWQALHVFLTNSRPALTYLSLNDTSDVDIRLLDCLHLCPSLRGLRINHGLVDSLMFAALASNDLGSGHMLVPRLSCLHLGACHDFEASDLLSMILDRYVASQGHSDVSPLRHIEMLYCNGLFVDNPDGASEDIKSVLGEAGARLQLTIDNGDSFPVPFGIGILPFVRVAESHQKFLADECEWDYK